jgi:hypothetical protein
LSQACPSGGKRGKIDSSEMRLGVSVMFLRAASFGESIQLEYLIPRLVRIEFFHW